MIETNQDLTNVRPDSAVIIDAPPPESVVHLGRNQPLNNGLTPLLTSRNRDWEGPLVERYITPPCIVESAGLAGHAVVVQLGAYCLGRRVKDGKIHDGIKMAGSVDIIPAGTTTRYDLSMMPAGSVTDDLMFNISPGFLERAAAQCERCPNQIELLPDFAAHDPHIESLARLFYSELENDCASGRLFYESLASALAARLLTNHAVFPARIQESKGGLSRPDLRRVLDYIGDNLGGDLSLANVAAVATFSPFHFARCFKQSVGQSVHQFVLEKRVALAKALLQKGTMTVAEVAIASGFSDQTHLGRHIKRQLSVTPAMLLPQRATRRNSTFRR